MATTIRTEPQAKTASCPVDQVRVDYRVEGISGLTLRVSKTSKTWRLRSRRAGIHALGTFPSVSLAEAKAAAAQLLGEAERAKVNKTSGPVLAVRDRRTLGEILDLYGAKREAAVASWPAQRAAIEYRYGDKLDATAARLTEATLLAPVEAERNVAAKRACRYLSTVLRWAKVGEPISNAELDDLVPEFADERVLTDAEVRAVLLAAKKLEPLWRDFTRAAILTMARRKDIAKARAEHFDLEAATWHMRVHKTRGHGVRIEAHPLSRQALALLARRAEAAGAGGWIFATRGGLPLRNNFDRILKRLHRLSGTSDWSWHDLRRTARTLMGRAGVRPDIAERCMSHQLSGAASRMGKVYDLYDYAEDMRTAYQALADALGAIEAKRPLLRIAAA